MANVRQFTIGSTSYQVVDTTARAAIGSPLVASTAAGMTDTSKIYVYVGSETGYTSGNWYYYDGSAWTSGGVYNSTALQTDTTLSVSGAAADSKKTGDEISSLNESLAKNTRTAFASIAKENVNGEITFPLAYGYWQTESDVLVWHETSNKAFLASAYPVKVDAGDVIHMISSPNTRYFATYSADGSTWSALVNTTNRDTAIPNSGYVLVSVRNEPASTRFTDAEIDTFFNERVVIVKGSALDKANIRINNSDSLTGILANEAGYRQVYVTASEETLSAAVASNIIIPLVTGDVIKIKASLSVTHPEYFSSVRLSVREYNNSSSVVKTTNYTDLTDIIEYTVTKATAVKVSFVFELVKESASSVQTGYYENIAFSLAVAKKEESIDSVLTESGDSWTV